MYYSRENCGCKQVISVFLLMYREWDIEKINEKITYNIIYYLYFFLDFCTRQVYTIKKYKERMTGYDEKRDCIEGGRGA